MKWKTTTGAATGTLALVAATMSALPGANASGGSESADQRADHRRCVTRGEYRALHDGLTLGRVQRILDAPGKVVRRDGGSQTRRWFVCGGGRETKVWVAFYFNGERWREHHKRTNAS